MRLGYIGTLVLLLIAVTTCSVFSATEDEIQKALEQRKSTDNLKSNYSLGDSNYKGTGIPSSLNLGADELRAIFLKGELSNSTTNQEKTSDSNRKAKLSLKAVPGDGLVKLSWKLYKHTPKPEDGQLRFSINYGTESGKLLRSVDAGTADSFVLRELKNHQIYYIQVIASASKNKLLIFQTDEESVTPLPVEEQGSKLEKAFLKKSPTLHDNLEPEAFKRELHQFGYDFFKNSSPNVNALDNMPASGSYILGPGDVLNLTIWGSFSGNHELTIDRNGEISIPKIGVVTVAGLAYDQARESIHKAISRYYKNFELNVTLGKIKTIQIFVVGEVESPGSIPVSSLSTTINALSAAGGPTRNGSLRTIRVMRNGKLENVIDLYDMFLSGDRSKDMRLQNGDTIFVPVIGPVVAVAGEIRRPAIYELKDKASLADVIKMAGGVTANGYIGRVQVERIANNNSKVALDYFSKNGQLDGSFSSVEIQDRDMVKVFPVQEAVRNVIVLSGNAVRPGEYQFRKGMRVKDIIGSYNDLLPESYMESAEITRLAEPDYHKEILTFNLRMVLNGSSEDNIELKEQDTLRVFSRWEMQEKPSVAINGYVTNPGTYDFNPGMTVRDLIAASGSTKRNAILDFAELTRVTIEGDKARSTRLPIDLSKALGNDPTQNIPLQPDDVLIVRGISEWIEATDKFVTVQGEVKYPGIYSLTRGEKISSVIERAGGYTDKAYLKGAKFTRRSVREMQQKRMDEIIARTEKDILQKQFSITYVAASKEELEGTRFALDSLLKGLERLKTLKAEGRIVIRLSKLDQFARSSFDLEMEGGDILDIPPRPNVVNVLGQVYNPTTLVHRPGSSDVDTYLSKAGGPTRDAEKSDMYIIRTDGSVFSRQQSSFGIKWSDESRTWNFGNFMSTEMDPGDTLVVPQKLEQTAWLRDIKDITTIISQIALTAGTVWIGLK
ncbi:MAG: SLBB domain-containing protein [Desulfuromonadales bacterium]|nr:SLBB domain-containing protein [Desulfuromonadales bacterium]